MDEKRRKLNEELKFAQLALISMVSNIGFGKVVFIKGDKFNGTEAVIKNKIKKPFSEYTEEAAKEIMEQISLIDSPKLEGERCIEWVKEIMRIEKEFDEVLFEEYPFLKEVK